MPLSTTRADYRDLIDIARYPIDDLDGPVATALLDSCREQLRTTGICQLEGFLTAESVAAMVDEADRNAAHAWVTDDSHTVYFEPSEPGHPAGHPLAHEVHSSERALAYDRVGANSPIRILYESDDMTRFIAAILAKEELHRSADPLDALQIAFFADGDELGWHFDRSEFSVTVMYREADAGGHFEYFPDMRSADEPNYEGVQGAIESDGAGAVRITTSPGTLAVFHGHHALHRVTRVTGSPPRINSVLTYGEQPGMRLNELTQQLFYGRIVTPE
jgi:hypothetical protein